MNDIDIIKYFASLNEEKRNELISLLYAKHCFGLAIKDNSENNLSEAIQSTERALKYQPCLAELHFILAICHLKYWGDHNFAEGKRGKCS